MMKMEIVFDEEKVRREGKWDIEKMYSVVDEFFAEHRMTKDEKGLYIGTGDKDEFAFMGVAYLSFRDEKWFTENVKKWNWYYPDTFAPDEICCDDMAAGLIEWGVGAPAYARAYEPMSFS
ncbi:hypothetical protein FACS1894111_09380 [Clostridia bacterium]|nr:hypothetical protein FACS1894111_09380 [Clostridia bacterium]